MTGDKELVVKRKSKIELAGEQVMTHLIELAKSSDMSYSAMSLKINEIYGLKLNKVDVCRFFKKNGELLIEDPSLEMIRTKIFLNANKELVKDIKKFDSEIEKLSGEEGELLEPDKRAKTIFDGLDKKGRLLLRHARLSGKFGDNGRGNNIGSMTQVNIFQQVDEEKSDIIEALKKVEFDKEEAIEVNANEIKETNTN